MTHTNATTYRCPSCGDAHSLEVAASMWVRLIQHEDATIETEPSKTDSSHEWNKDSNVVCTACRWSGAMFDADRREYLRGELRAERMSYGELAELQDLAEQLDAGDVELLEAAGVPEFPEEEGYKSQAARDAQASGYGDDGYWDYLDKQAEEHRAYFLAHGDLVRADEMMTQSLSDALRGNDGD